MTIRRNARWQDRLDERILEHLYDELYSYPEFIAMEPMISVREGTIRDRCKELADAGLIHIDIEDGWRLEICGLGERYLRGEVDVEMFPYPRPVPKIDEEIRNNNK
ncbi:hypothetical protein GJ631_14915 [Natronomonas sp. CBA1123]|uniref:hypothetical protein n=1 Tax=Natronomonas sp. CBA1123 TaxID=2668070 RepID=UPI0012EA63B9|nr:hypothetical protein [Natronomonas sp. CBA1123]MUV87807.1 hypothetical protein [Natronomonas sp. CBA1123]